MLLSFIHVNEEWKQNRRGTHRGTAATAPAARRHAPGPAPGARPAEAGHAGGRALGRALRPERRDSLQAACVSGSTRGGGAADETTHSFAPLWGGPDGDSGRDAPLRRRESPGRSPRPSRLLREVYRPLWGPLL